MKNDHLTDIQIDKVVHSEMGNHEFYSYSENEISNYKNHIKSCVYCKADYIDSTKLYKKLNRSNKMIISYVASLLILCTLTVFYFQQAPQIPDTMEFQKNIEFEQLIGQSLRADGFTPSDIVISPKNEHIYSESIPFILGSELSGNHKITLFSANEELIYEGSFNSDSVHTVLLSKEGIYYWQLENDKEIIFYGKFYHMK